MRNKRPYSLLLIAIALVVGLVAVANASPRQELARAQAAPRLAEATSDTILYTVVRGSHEDAVRAFHGLVALRDDMGLPAAGDWGAFVYHEVPDGTTKDQLIEVQIPVGGGTDGVDKQAYEAASQYQLGTTGVKTLPPRSVVSVTKAKGVADPTSLYKDLYSYIERNSLSVSGSAYEQFSQVEEIPDTCAVDELETTISIPVS